MKFLLYSLLFLTTSLVLFSCDEDTALVGQSIMPGKDLISTSQDTFYVKTTSLEIDSVLANTSVSLLGSIIDPETRATTTSGFLAQFHILEKTTFPNKDSLIWDTDNLPQIDSIYMHLFVDNYYGDSLRTMTLTVQELDTSKIMSEGKFYYTNLDPQKFITNGVGVQANTTYSVHDETVPSNIASGTRYHYIRVNLPISLGKRILSKYYENANFFKNSQTFLRHVLAGFHFSTQGSVGTMLQIPFTTLNIHFKYLSKGVATAAYAQLATTEEVIQNTTVSSKVPTTMLDPNNEYTYIKSPSSIFTEGVIPVDEIRKGHLADTINNARLIVRTYNSTTTEKGILTPPTNLLLIAKDNAQSFFEKNSLPNNYHSFLATFSNGNYTFSNIGPLITYCHAQRDKGAGVTENDTETQKAIKYATWEANHPDWNKFILVPVTAQYSVTINPITRQPMRSLRRLHHSMGLNSVKLDGGASKGLEMNVMYSSFKN